MSGFVIVAIVTFGIFLFTLFTTNPTKLGPGGVTFWFINMLFFLSSALTLVFYYLKKRRSKSTEFSPRGFRSSIRSGSLIGLSLTVLLALSSLRSLSWRDIILFFLMIVLVEVYFRTRKEAS